eukprot:gene6568-biopygen8467
MRFAVYGEVPNEATSAAGAVAGRLSTASLLCPTEDEVDDLPRLPLHPTQLHRPAFSLPNHAGCVIGNLVVAAAVTILGAGQSWGFLLAGRCAQRL